MNLRFYVVAVGIFPNLSHQIPRLVEPMLTSRTNWLLSLEIVIVDVVIIIVVCSVIVEEVVATGLLLGILLRTLLVDSATRNKEQSEK